MSFATLRSFLGGAATGGQDIDLSPASPIVLGAGQTLAISLSDEASAGVAQRNGLCSVTVVYTLPFP